MGDAEQANIARTLKSVNASLQELVRVMTAINENLVIAGKGAKTWFESIEEVPSKTQGVSSARSAE